MADRNWTRWIHASVAKYLKQVAVDNNIPVLIEGIDDRDQSFMEAPDRVEVRLNGPFSQELSRGYHRLYVDINVLLSSQMGGESKNAYDLDARLGIFHEAMDGVISIFKVGTGPDDDQSLLVCLTPRPGKNDSVRVVHFGQIERTDRLKQGVVDARYIGHINS
jgi:hypothetical protein